MPRRNLLLCLLVFSLTLNLGIIATFAYTRFVAGRAPASMPAQSPWHLRDLWRALNLGPEQHRQMGELLPEHRRRVRELRLTLAQKREELFEMMRRGTSSWPDMQSKIREISSIQGRLEEEVVRLMLECRQRLTPEQKAIFLCLLERRITPGRSGKKESCAPRGGRGRGQAPGNQPRED